MIQSRSRSSLTRQHEQDKPIHDQHGPKDRQIKHLKPTTHETQRDRPRCGMPELELGQSPNEGTKLLILLRGQTRLSILQSLVLIQRRIEFRLQKGEEEIEQVDA
jgi:hypothetical protein